MFRNPDLLTQISTHDWNNLFIQHMVLCEDWIEVSYSVLCVICQRVLCPSKCSLSSPGPWRHFSNAKRWLEALLLECMLCCLVKLIWLMTWGMERQPWALSYSLSLFPRVTLDVSVVACSLLSFSMHSASRRGEVGSFQVCSKVLVQGNQIFKTRVF